MEMNTLELTGRARSHVVEVPHCGCALHYETVASYLAMREAARAEGIDLTARSGFRDYARQLTIWNRKWRGELALYDRQNRLIQRAALDDAATIDAILAWSAIPGGSRHHWGTDIDVIDAAAVSADYKVQFVPPEYESGGVFARLSAWLDENLARFGFFRPYRTDRGGVSPELWHLSYAPVSTPALGELTIDLLQQTLLESEIEGKDLLVQRLPEIHRRYIANIDTP